MSEKMSRISRYYVYTHKLPAETTYEYKYSWVLSINIEYDHRLGRQVHPGPGPRSLVYPDMTSKINILKFVVIIRFIMIWNFEYDVGLGDSEPLEETSEEIARSILEGLVHQVAGAFYMHELAFFCIL